MLSAVSMLLAGHVHAADSLSCRLKQSAGQGTPFAWSYAHSEADGPSAIETSIGTLAPAEGPNYTTAVTLDGQPIALPAEHAGQIRFGKVFELATGVALAYSVTRDSDSMAAPSQLVVLLDKAGKPIEIQVQPGDTEPDPNHCNLIN